MVDVLTLASDTGIRRYRTQVPLVLLISAVSQMAVGYSFRNTLASSDYASVLLALFANFVSLLVFRRMRHHPGANRFASLTPSFVVGWGLVFAFVALLRLPYSALTLGVGAICGFGATLVLSVLIRRPGYEPFLVVPSMQMNAMLSQLDSFSYKLCPDPGDLILGTGPIVADLRADLPPETERAIVQATLDGRKVYHIKQIMESITGRVQIDHLSENALGTLAPNESYAFVKSIIERFVAVILFILCLPVFALASLAIKLESNGPALFRQARIGFRGKRFTILKLRTMRVTEAPATRESDITKSDDPRITKLGQFLRGSRIDELPQLINIIRGEMSFVGPRPETERLSQWYDAEIDFYAYRHVVLPGITGWAQVRQGHVASPDDVFRKLQYDFYYIKNYSFWLDVVIALETVKVMLLRLGAK